jgi:uncharacterized membrane protein YoaK (UPF0700 family)
MIHRLPRWVWVGAWSLAFIAGMVNMVGLLSFEHQAVTHLTGTTSMLSAALAEGQFRGALRLAAVLASFLGGAVLCGCIVQDSTLKLGRRYGIALFLESLFLLASVPLLQNHAVTGACLLSCGCGLQNAMASTYSGTIIRTTHLSGMFTDLGVFLGHALRGIPVEPRRLQLCVVIISAFLLGGIGGAVTFRHFSYHTLLIPAGLTGVTAIIYGIYRHRIDRNTDRGLPTGKPLSGENPEGQP